MPFSRMFDAEVDRAAFEGCLNDGAIADADSYCLPLTSSSANLSTVAPGVYQVFLAGLDPSATVLVRAGRTSDPLPLPTSSTSQRVTLFPGSVVARIRVLPGNKVVSARLISGSGDLYLVPLVAL